VKERLFSGLSIASSLVTLAGVPFFDGAPVINHIDLGATVMVMTAAFGWGGAALGAIDVQIAKGWTSRAAAGQFRRGFEPSRSLHFDAGAMTSSPVHL
jgi:hypothetical protein